MNGEHVNWIENRDRCDYIRSIVISAPPWLTIDDRKEINMLAEWCKVMQIMTGKLHCLDHIVPVTHWNVCGLTVPWNIQVIPSKANSVKSNTFCPEQGELFTTAVPTDTPTCGLA